VNDKTLAPIRATFNELKKELEPIAERLFLGAAAIPMSVTPIAGDVCT
jgi:hypothetical protein